MKNILWLIKNDLNHLRYNYLAWVVIIGLLIIPALYAWFSTYAFWDPYNNTGNMTIAVANSDEGISSDVLPINVRIGDKIIEALEENDDINWLFLDEDEAIDGVRAGEYYAAFVIPADFSRRMFGIFDDDSEKAEIDYYLNEKKNVIAAKVTDEGAAMLKEEIDKALAKTVAEVGVETMEGIASYLDNSDADSVVADFDTEMKSIGSKLTSAADTVAALRDMNASLTSLLNTVDSLLQDTSKSSRGHLNDLSRSGKDVKDLGADVSAVADRTEKAIADTESLFKKVDQQISGVLDSADSSAESVAKVMSASAGDIQALIDRYEDYQQTVSALAAAIPDEDIALKAALGRLNANLSGTLQHLKNLRDELNRCAAELTTTSADVSRYQKELSAVIAAGGNDIAGMRETFRKDVRPKWKDLESMLSRAGETAAVIVSDLKKDLASMQKISTDATAAINATNNSLADTEKLLREAAVKTEKINAALVDDDGMLKSMLTKVDGDEEQLGEIFASAVEVEENRIYPVENFASGMAPFYTSLALYVGALVMVALMKVFVSPKAYRELEDVKDYQLYFGRGFIFIAIGIVQSLIVALGMLFFLEIQCVHPLRFIFTAVVVSFIFVVFLYTLTASFGNIGKAIAVIIMVLQVGGSGGTLPIQLVPKFFQKVYPFLPFTHSMTAFRECIAGFYANTYWLSLGKLSLFFVFSLLLGLLLRKPLLKLNQAFIEKVESTEIM